MIFLVYALLGLTALLLVWQYYGTFRTYEGYGGRLGWQASLGDPNQTRKPSAYLLWEKYTVRTQRWKPDVRVEQAQPFLGYQPALVVRWRGFRLVLLGRLK